MLATHDVMTRDGGRGGLALQGRDQPVLHGPRVEHGLRRGEGLAHHDH